MSKVRHIFKCCFLTRTIKEPNMYENLFDEKNECEMSNNINSLPIMEYMEDSDYYQYDYSNYTNEERFNEPVSDLVDFLEKQADSFPFIYNNIWDKPNTSQINCDEDSSSDWIDDTYVNPHQINIQIPKRVRNIVHKSCIIGKLGKKTNIFLEYMIPIDEDRVVNIQD